jgi:CBS domain-containing protein
MKITGHVGALLSAKNPALHKIAPDATVFEAIKLMAEKNVGALLVMAGDELVGIMTERDYTRKVALQGRSSKETRVREIIPAKLLTVTPTYSVEDCMRLMTEHRVRHLPVLEDGKVTGIVSIGDLVNWTIFAQNAALDQMEQYITGGYPQPVE